MKLIIGLGNPGDQYKNTRHNAGFMAADSIAQAFRFDPFKKADKFKADVTEGMIGGEKVILAKPQTFMNLSGQAALLLSNYYKLQPTDTLVIYDDVEIPLGSLRIREGGTSGGHNGISSILQELATLEIPRIRIGIKPEKPFMGALEDYVLGTLAKKEQEAFEQLFAELPKIIESILTGGIETAMNAYN